MNEENVTKLNVIPLGKKADDALLIKNRESTIERLKQTIEEIENGEIDICIMFCLKNYSHIPPYDLAFTTIKSESLTEGSRIGKNFALYEYILEMLNALRSDIFVSK